MAISFQGDQALGSAYDVLRRLRESGGDGTGFALPEQDFGEIARGLPGGVNAIPQSPGLPADYKKQEAAESRQAERSGGRGVAPKPGQMMPAGRVGSFPPGYAEQERVLGIQAQFQGQPTGGRGVAPTPGQARPAAQAPQPFRDADPLQPIGSGAAAPAPAVARSAPSRPAVAIPGRSSSAAPAVPAVAPPAPSLPPVGGSPAAASVSAAPAVAPAQTAAAPQRSEPLSTEELDTLQRDVFMNSPDTATGARDLRRLLHDQVKALGYEVDENPNAYSISGLRKKLQEPLPDAGKTDAEALDAYLQSRSRPGDTQVAFRQEPQANLMSPELSDRIEAIAGQAYGNLTVMNGDGGVDPNMLSAYANAGVTRRGTPDERWAFAHNLLNNMSAGPRGMVNLGFVPEDQLPPMGTSTMRQIGALLPR